MSIIAWIILGLIAGFIASTLVNKTGEGIVLDVVLGIVGAVVGGALFHLFGMSGVTGLNIYSLLVAVIGAMECGIFHDFSRFKYSSARPTSIVTCRGFSEDPQGLSTNI